MFGYTLIEEAQQLLDLNAPSIQPNIASGVVKILVVDNKEVPQVDILKERGFSIKKINDVEDLNAISTYDIAMIDIKDIGGKFQSPFEGAYVAKRAKEIYPYKKIILFTGETYEDKYNDIMRMCDGYINKDACADDWEDLLNKRVLEVTNPVLQWKAIRHRLLDSDVSLLLVYKLEQKYISAIKEKNSSIFPGHDLINALPNLLKDTVVELTKSAIFMSLGIQK